MAIRHALRSITIMAPALALALAGCAAIPQAEPPPHRKVPQQQRPATKPRPRPHSPAPAARSWSYPPAAQTPRPGNAGPARVIGANMRMLEAMFGRAAQDLRGPTVRRVQFVGASCILDAYLYPPARGGEPVVTWIDTRRPSGDVVDKEWCVSALSRR